MEQRKTQFCLEEWQKKLKEAKERKGTPEEEKRAQGLKKMFAEGKIGYRNFSE